MKKATIRFIIITGMLLKLFSVTAYAENALASSFVLAAGFLNGENPAIYAGVNLDKIPLFDESSSGTLLSIEKSAENMSSSTTTFAADTNEGRAAILAAGTFITVSAASAPYTGTVNLSATLRKIFPPNAVSGKTITFKLDGDIVGSAQTDKNGTASLQDVHLTADLNVGPHAIKAEFAGDGGYSGSTGLGLLTVTYAPTQLSVDNVSATYGSTVTIRGRLTSVFTGQGLKDKVLTVFINNEVRGMAATDADGVGTLDVDLGNLDIGTYPILVTFLQVIGNYSPNTASATLKVEELPTSLTLSASEGTYGGNVRLEAALTASGAPVINKTVKFTFNGSSYSAQTDSLGIAAVDNVSISGIDAGVYKGIIAAEFASSGIYSGSSSAGDLTVDPAPTALSVSNSEGTFGGLTGLTARLTSGGVPISGRTISFKLQDNDAGSIQTDAEGTAFLSGVSLQGIDAGEYEGAVRASFLASGNYASSSASGKLKVEQAASLVVVKSAVGTYNGKVILSAVLTAASSGIPLGGRTVYFKLNEEEKGSALTGDDGVATFPEVSIAGIPVGNYESCIEAGFSPSGGNYAPSKGKGSLEVGLAPTSIALNKITAIYGGKVDLEATLTCYGAPLSGKPVEFSLNGQLVGAAITDAEGKAIKNCIDLTGIGAGVHPGAFCASFLESNPYKGCTRTADIEITKACTQVRVLPVEVQYSDQVTLKAVVTSAAQENLNKSGGSVEFKYQLNNEPENTLGTVRWCAISDGKMVFSYEFTCDLDPDQYKIFAEFTPSDQANFNGSCNATPNGPLLVEPEDALVEYTGNRYFSTPPSCEGTPLTLSASITDTADYDRGNISNARVEFREAALGALYNDWIVQATNLPVILSDQADNTAGNSTAQPFCRHLSQSEINNSGTVFDIYTKVRGNYTRLSSPSLVTIGVSGNDNISGGGFIVPKSPAGKYCGSKGEKTDFGFTMKYDKSCESVPGQAGIIIRGGNGRIYQVMSRAISSLSAYPIDNMPGKAASFSAKSDLIDITNPFNQVTLSREVCLTIQMYEDSKDGKMDAISITLLGVNSELLYSNNWDGSKTLPQNLDMSNGGGTIKVLGSSVLSGVDGEAVIPKEYALFQNYPNPFNPSTTIQYDLPEESNVKIAIYDILGKKISQIVNGEVPAGRHRAVWNSQESGSFASGIYILHIYAESLSSKRNIISSKKMHLIK